MRRAPVIFAGLVFSLLVATASQAAATHGMSLYGDLKYGPDFENFDYVNPNAPSGGTLGFAAIGTVDTLHTFSFQGSPAGRVGRTFCNLPAPSPVETPD